MEICSADRQEFLACINNRAGGDGDFKQRQSGIVLVSKRTVVGNQSDRERAAFGKRVGVVFSRIWAVEVNERWIIDRRDRNVDLPAVGSDSIGDIVSETARIADGEIGRRVVNEARQLRDGQHVTVVNRRDSIGKENRSQSRQSRDCRGQRFAIDIRRRREPQWIRCGIFSNGY